MTEQRSTTVIRLDIFFPQMIRRSPARIELKLEDLQEYDNMRREQDPRRAEAISTPSTNATANSKMSWEQIPNRVRPEVRIGLMRQLRYT